jgi:hypothetical protein
MAVREWLVPVSAVIYGGFAIRRGDVDQSLIIFLVVGYFWARFVPAVVSFALGIIAWGAFAWLSWHHL